MLKSVYRCCFLSYDLFTYVTEQDINSQVNQYFLKKTVTFKRSVKALNCSITVVIEKQHAVMKELINMLQLRNNGCDSIHLFFKALKIKSVLPASTCQPPCVLENQLHILLISSNGFPASLKHLFGDKSQSNFLVYYWTMEVFSTFKKKLFDLCGCPSHNHNFGQHYNQQLEQ